ncbi:MAG: aminodeoxychorismate/anthranilate synthase component II [Abditibacteriota bacterium]|nr:aminodeoxychorismate/anthranilate synthase component II [Abditibacteriota bacterium]
MILLIDNYDSFSYNLYQMTGEIEPDIRVVRNDELTPAEIGALAPEKIILSPGPGRPENAGCIIDAVRELGGTIPILGVCLGHQAVCAAYGADITYARELMHGKQSRVTLDRSCPLFKNCPDPTYVARYHSLAADRDTLPSCLKVCAETADGEVMAVMHDEYPVYGLQFHPESVLTLCGRTILYNFIREVKR